MNIGMLRNMPQKYKKIYLAKIDKLILAQIFLALIYLFHAENKANKKL